MITRPKPRHPWWNPKRWRFEIKWWAIRDTNQAALQRAVGATDEQMAEWIDNWLNGEKP